MTKDQLRNIIRETVEEIIEEGDGDFSFESKASELKKVLPRYKFVFGSKRGNSTHMVAYPPNYKETQSYLYIGKSRYDDKYTVSHWNHERNNSIDSTEGLSWDGLLKTIKRYSKDLSESLNESSKYQDFVKKVMDRFGVDRIDAMSDEKKKRFFDYLDKNWNAGENETDLDEKFRPGTASHFNSILEKWAKKNNVKFDWKFVKRGKKSDSVFVLKLDYDGYMALPDSAQRELQSTMKKFGVDFKYRGGNWTPIIAESLNEGGSDELGSLLQPLSQELKKYGETSMHWTSRPGKNKLYFTPKGGKKVAIAVNNVGMYIDGVGALKGNDPKRLAKDVLKMTKNLSEERRQFTPTKSDKIAYVGYDTKSKLWWFKAKTGRKAKTFKTKAAMEKALKKIGGLDGNVIATINKLDEGMLREGVTASELSSIKPREIVSLASKKSKTKQISLWLNSDERGKFEQIVRDGIEILKQGSEGSLKSYTLKTVKDELADYVLYHALEAAIRDAKKELPSKKPSLNEFKSIPSSKMTYAMKDTRDNISKILNMDRVTPYDTGENDITFAIPVDGYTHNIQRSKLNKIKKLPGFKAFDFNKTSRWINIRFHKDGLGVNSESVNEYRYRNYTSRSGDPRWIKAKYAGTADDGTRFKKGEKVLFWPRGGKNGKNAILVGKQADKEWREFQSNAADEEWMAGQFGSGMYREGVSFKQLSTNPNNSTAHGGIQHFSKINGKNYVWNYVDVKNGKYVVVNRPTDTIAVSTMAGKKLKVAKILKKSVSEGVVSESIKATAGDLLDGAKNKIPSGDRAKLQKIRKDSIQIKVEPRDTSGMRGSQDKFMINVYHKGKKIMDLGSHPSERGAENMVSKWLGYANESLNEINLNKHVKEGWTVKDFIDELEPQLDMIMRGNSWQNPIKTKAELKKWCMDNQPFYKKHIPDVVAYFAKKYRIK